MKTLKCFIKDEKGQGLVEYALIIGIIAIGLVAALAIFSESLQNLYETIKEEIEKAAPEDE